MSRSHGLWAAWVRGAESWGKRAAGRKGREGRGRHGPRDGRRCCSAEVLESRRLLTVAGDGFGYVADPADYEAIDLVPGGAGVGSLLQSVDDTAEGIDLGANTFTFYGETYSGAGAVYVSSNGLLTFGGADPNTGGDLSFTYGAAIAPAWRDWVTYYSADDQVLTKFADGDADGDADRLVVEWNMVSLYGGSPSPATFQAVLALNTGDAPGDVVFNYPDLNVGYADDASVAGTVGIKDAGFQGGNRLIVSYYGSGPGTELVGSGKALRIHWAGNDAPTADAGPPSWYGAPSYSVAAGYPVQLDASDTFDPQQSSWTLNYEWDFDDDGVFGEFAWEGGLRGTELGINPVFDSQGLSAGSPVTVSVRAIDGGGLVSEPDTAVIALTPNADPVADAGPPPWYGVDSYTVVEGRFVQVSGEMSFDPEGYGFNWDDFAWDFDADGLLGETWDGGADNGHEVGVVTEFWANGMHAGQSRQIVLRVTDLGGATGTDTATVNVVANQGPVADAGGPYAVTAGGFGFLNAYGTFDPDEGLGWEAFQWDLDGDGEYGETSWNGGTPDQGDELGPEPLFLAAGLDAGESVTVSLRVTDSGGLSSVDTATIEIIPNLPPVANAGPPSWWGTPEYTVWENDYVWLAAYESYDPNGDPLYWENFQWDLDGDGLYGEPQWDGGTRGHEIGVETYFIAAGIDGPAVYEVALRVSDPAGLAGEDTAIVRVLGFEPTAIIRGAPASGSEGTAIVLESTVMNAAPGASYAWMVTRDGGDEPYATGTLPSFSFVPDQDGSYRVTLVVTEPDGDASPLTIENDRTIEVTNVAPRLNGVSVDSAAIDEGGTVTLTGSYNDLGSLDSHAVTIDWGDGNVETVALGPVGPNLPLSAPREFGGHTYYAIEGGLLTWEQAEAEAQRLGGHLVTIGSADENLFLTDFGRSVYGDVSVWTGLSDADTEGTFAWSSGEPVTFTNWDGGEPNDAQFFGGEDYGELRLWSRNANGGRWNDLPVGGTLGTRVGAAIIELDAPAAAAAPTFTASHRYADDSSGLASGNYTISVALEDDDGASATLPRGLVQWAEADGGNGHYYLLTDGVMTWPQAEAQAETMGGHLVSILSGAEQDFLIDRFLSAANAYTSMWMGFNDIASEGQWVWTTGEAVTYTRWHPGEPNNWDGSQDYGVFNFSRAGSGVAGLWDDDGLRNGTVIRPGVIELEAAPAGLLPVLSVTVNNTGPVITAASSDAAEIGDAAAGELVTVSADFTDAGDDAHSFSVDWGDGTSSAGTVDELLGAGSATAGHAYASGGVYTAVLTLTDDGGAVATRSLTVYVSGSGVHNGELQIVGTAGADNVKVEKLSDGSLLLASTFALSAGRIGAADLAGVRSVLLMLGAGDDLATVVASNLVPVLIDGGAGNDTLKGANGSNVLLGGDGNDLLIGGTARDLLIGGRGADQLVGNAGDDVLVAGTTAHDGSPAALSAIAADWRGAGTVAQRVARLKAGVGTGGGLALNASTVFDDAAADLLTGSAGGDWFLFWQGSDRVTDQVTGDQSLILA